MQRRVKSITSEAKNVWTLGQHLVVRGAIALKFFLAARMLGPEQIGAIGVALLVLAIAEGLTDTGMLQAVVQSKKDLRSTQLGSLWTLQCVRGVSIALALSIAATPAARIFHVAGSADVLLVTALLPFVKGIVNPGILRAQRDRSFSRLFVYESAGALTDLLTTLFLIQVCHTSVIGMAAGALAGEVVKVSLSWTWLRVDIRPNLRWRLISHLTSFGKWVWGASLLTLILNQFDKILVARLLGPSEFGFYNVALRIAQLVIAEPAFAMAQYLFPTLAKLNRDNENAVRPRFYQYIRRISVPLFLAATSLFLLAGSLLEASLGKQWLAAQGVLRVACFTMLLAASIASIVAYLRAVGLPQVVARAVLFQLSILGVAAPLLVPSHGAIGAAIASAVAHAGTFLYLAKMIGFGCTSPIATTNARIHR